MIAVGWMDGTLRIVFPKATWDYAGVPEDKFVSIRKVPFPYSYFMKAIKGKFTGTKVA